MRKIDRSATKAGLFIVASLVLLLVIVASIKGIGTIFTPVVERRVQFSLTDDIGGLRLGDDVRLGGFKVGAIRAIEVLGTGEGQQPVILITFTAPEKYPLRKNAHIAVQGTVTGSSWLNIDDLGSGEMLAEADVLTGHPSATAELLAGLSKTTPELEAMVHDVHAITIPKVNTALDKSHKMIDSITGFANHGSELAANASDLLGDTKPDIRGTLKNLNSITASTKTRLPKVLDDADATLVKVTAAIDNSKGTLQDLSATMANTKGLTAAARSILIDNRGKIDGIIASLKTTSDNAKFAIAEVRRSPWRLLYKPAPGEMDNLNLFDAARQFADGANSVDDAATSLRDASRDPTVDPERLKKLMAQLNQSFANFKEVEQKLWEAVKE